MLSWDDIQLRHKLEVQQHLNHTLSQELQTAWKVIREQQRELKLMRFKLAQTHGKELLKGGREHLTENIG